MDFSLIQGRSMEKIGLFLLLGFSTVFTVACGGGGGEASAPTQGASSSDMLNNPSAYSVAQLNKAAIDLVDSRYTGSLTEAAMDIELAQNVFVELFGDSVNTFPGLISDTLVELVETKGDFNQVYSCIDGGTVRYKGSIDSNYRGAVSLDYDACVGEAGSRVDGHAAFRMVTLSDQKVDLVFYYDSLRWQRSGQSTVVSGYSRQTEDVDSFVQVQDLLFVSDGYMPVRLSSKYNESINGSWSILGDLFIADKGRVSFVTNELIGSTPQFVGGSLILETDKTTAIQFDPNYIRYVEDIDGDKQFDVGSYFSSIEELLTGDTSSKQLVALSQLSLPPEVFEPRWDWYSNEVNTTTSITVEEGYYRDPDTPFDQLSISYHWYVNGTLLSETSNTLAPYQAVYGDVLEVAMVVFDGGNSVEGPRLTIPLADSPIQAEVTNLPEKVVSGESVNFSVYMVDPDITDVQTPALMVSGPAGAAMDDLGQVTWQVPDNLLFPIQHYTFNFTLPGSDEISSVTVEARSSDSFPIVRTGVQVPYQNQSIWIGDFDLEEGNELLSVGSESTLYLLEYTAGDYQQKWVYPFSMPTEGNIKQALSADIDNDGKQEIIVVTDHGISLVNGLNEMASVVLTSEKYIRNVSFVKANGGWLLGYLESSLDYAYDNVVMTVVDFSAPDIPLFNQEMLNAKQFVFANVDEDTQLELVTNNGFVYDTISWENQWFNGSGFGQSLVFAGDLDGDGIDEIIGDTIEDYTSSIGVYSAISKSSIYQYADQGFCDVITADVTNDDTDELILGECQWGSVKVVDWDGTGFSVLSQLSSEGYGLTSLAVGDSDNDGQLELHWASGIGSTGADSLVSADIVNSTIQKKMSSQVQLDSYTTAGWSTISEGIEKAVFFVPSSNSDYDGSRILTLDKQGKSELSDELSSNWDNSHYAMVSDFNHDGFGDIFLPLADIYNGAIAAMQLFDSSIHWQLQGSYDTNIGVIEAADLNGDGFDDLIYDDGSAIRIVDIENQILLGSFTPDQSVQDITTYTQGNDNYIVVGTTSSLQLFKLGNGTPMLFNSQQQACSRVEMFNYDSDDTLELICLRSDIYSPTNSSLIVYEISNGQLTETSRVDLPYGVLDIAIDPSSAVQQHIFAAVRVPRDYSNGITEKHYIQNLSAEGLVIWSSPYIVGMPSHRGINVRYSEAEGLEMLLSTNRAVYWLN